MNSSDADHDARAFHCFGPVPESAIDAAEAHLGVIFPLDYRSFLKQFGAAWIDGTEIAGVTTDQQNELNPPLWESVVNATLSSRGDNPRSLVFISGDGGDVSYCLDTASRDLTGKCPVVAFGPGYDCVLVAASFDDFTELAASGRLATPA